MCTDCGFNVQSGICQIHIPVNIHFKLKLRGVILCLVTPAYKSMLWQPRKDSRNKQKNAENWRHRCTMWTTFFFLSKDYLISSELKALTCHLTGVHHLLRHPVWAWESLFQMCPGLSEKSIPQTQARTEQGDSQPLHYPGSFAVCRASCSHCSHGW